MVEHPFSQKKLFIDSATADDWIQPSEFFSNLKSMRNHQTIHLTNTKIMKSSYTGQLPNLSMLDSESTTTQMHPNINNISLISLRKSCDDNCEVKLTNNWCTFHQDNTPITITVKCFKKRMHMIDLMHNLYLEINQKNENY